MHHCITVVRAGLSHYATYAAAKFGGRQISDCNFLMVTISFYLLKIICHHSQNSVGTSTQIN